MKNKGRNIAKFTAICFSIFAAVGLLAIGAYFITSTYFFKNQETKGYIRFSPGIYLEFNPQTIEIDEENTSNWSLKYYKDKDLSSTPVVLNTADEPASPMTEYFVLSPEFKCGKEGNRPSATILARARLNYSFTNDDSALSQEQLDYLFDETLFGSGLKFSSSWVNYDGWFYYVGNNNVQAITSVSDLAEIEYSENAPYISIFETNQDGIALVRFANQSPENYQSLGIDSFNITLTMEFTEVGSDTLLNWIN